MEEEHQDEYIEEIDDMDDEDYDEDEGYDEVNENDLRVQHPGQNPPYQVIGNQFIDNKGRPQSAKVKSSQFGNQKHNFYPTNENDPNGNQPMQAYQYNYQGDALNIVRQYAGKGKNKRPMSASNMGTTLTATNSKMPSDISYMDIKKMKPRRINQEKEKLYEQVIKLKVQMNTYKNANLKLRTQLKFLEKEGQEKEGIIEDLAHNNEVTTIGRLGNVGGNKRKSESYLITALKRQVKELKQEVKDKDEEIQTYKKNFKNTKMNELDIELRSYMDECLRLRHLLEDTVKSKDPLTDPEQLSNIEEQFQQQNAIIGNLQTENQELQNLMGQKENESLEWRNLVEEYQKRINRLRPAAKDNKKLRRLNKEKKTELQRIRQELLLLRSKTSPEIKQKVDEMMKKQDDLAGKVGNNRAKITNLKKDKNKLQEQKKELIDKVEELENERDQINNEIEEEINLKKKFEELYSEEREKNLALRQHLDSLTKEDKKPVPRNQSARPKSASKYGRKAGSDDAREEEDDQLGSESEEKEILLNQINYAEIEPIAKELAEVAASKGINFYSFQGEFQGDQITLTELKDLIKERYQVGESSSLMMARFIYEADDIDADGKVLFDELKQLDFQEVADRVQQLGWCNSEMGTHEPKEEFGEFDMAKSHPVEEIQNDYPVEEEINQEINESIPQESLPRESIEVDKEIGDQAVPSDHPSEQIKDEVDEDIDDDYGDIEDDFEVEKEQVEVKQSAPTKDSPKIEEEEPPKPAFSSEVQKSPSEPEESEIGEDEGLEIAEKCFNKMADMMKAKNTTTINHFKDFIASQVVETDEGQEFEIVYIPPVEFLEGINQLGLELTEREIKCLMIILVKPELDNVVLVQDLCMVMENFGIQEDIDDEGSARKEKESNDDQENPGAPSVPLASSSAPPQKSLSSKGQEDNYENEFEEQESDKFRSKEPKENLAVPEEKFELHESDAEKDKEEIYQHKLDKLEKEDEDKYDFDIDDDFETKKKPTEPEEEIEDNYTDPKDEIEDKYSEPKPSEPKEEIEDKYSGPKEEIEDNYTEPKEEIEDKYSEPKEEIDEKYSEPSEEIEEKYSEPKESIHENISDHKASDDKKSEPKQDSDGIDDNHGEEFDKKSSKKDPSEDKESDKDKSSDRIEEKNRSPTETEENKEGTDDVTSKGTRKKKHMKFEILEPKSLRILYDMTSYLGAENSPDDLFNDKIYEQLIKTKKKENMVELISAEDFFEILEEHEVIKKYSGDDLKSSMMVGVKENLQELLCLDPQYKDLLMMK